MQLCGYGSFFQYRARWLVRATNGRGRKGLATTCAPRPTLRRRQRFQATCGGEQEEVVVGLE